MMTGSSQPQGLGRYLARRGFAPSPGNPTWLDLGTGQQTVRVLHEPGESTLLYCLDSHGGCQYEAVFSPGTPATVIIAAIEAALRPPPGPASARPGRPQAGGARANKDGDLR